MRTSARWNGTEAQLLRSMFGGFEVCLGEDFALCKPFLKPLSFEADLHFHTRLHCQNQHAQQGSTLAYESTHLSIPQRRYLFSLRTPGRPLNTLSKDEALLIRAKSDVGVPESRYTLGWVVRCTHQVF